MAFPTHRPRRLRRTEAIRSLVRETRLSAQSFVYPLFVCPGRKIKEEISSMPGNYRWSVDLLVDECRAARDLGIPAVILFGIPATKDPVGSDACDPKGIVQKAVRALKKSVPELIVICDLCLCEYTSHGHCGVVKGTEIDNDATLRILAKAAVVQAQAGADMVAPSDMMDGRVGAIRHALDDHGFTNVPVMAYSAKYASGFYGPFREAAESTPQFGDRRSYQMDPGNGIEALRETRLDVEEGADIVMVKPALSYLDIIASIHTEFDLPVAAYNVSGEYAMIEAAAANGWIEKERVVMETLTGIRRAGADMILTYHALYAAALLAKR